jgi:hypothetical protein
VRISQPEKQISPAVVALQAIVLIVRVLLLIPLARLSLHR